MKFIPLALASCLFLASCEISTNYEQPSQGSPEESTDIQETDDNEKASNQQWSTYTSEKYGFVVNFPSMWSVEEDSHERPYIFFTSPERAEADQEEDPIVIDARIIVYATAEELPNNDDGLSFENWIKTEEKYFNGEVEFTTVDGVDAYLINTTGFAGIASEFIMVEHEGKIYELNFNVPDANDYTEERQQMLESFQFLASSTNETSSTSSSSCNEEVCFVENFNTCESATMSSDLDFAAVSYSILGETNEGCEVEMVYTKNPNPAWVNQPIVCTLDTNVDFLPAWQKEFEAAVQGKGNCTGPLTEILKNL